MKIIEAINGLPYAIAHAMNHALRNSADTKVNKAGVDNAHALVDAGKVNKGTWDFSAEDGNKLLGAGGDDWAAYGKWMLATHPSAKEGTKDYYGYPFGKGGEVYRNAIISAKGRAAQQGADDVRAACSALLDKIDGKQDDSSAQARARRHTFFAKGKGPDGELYLYDDIGDGYFGGVSANDIADALKGLGSVDTLHCYVNSAGGSVFEGVAIYNQLKRFKAKKVMHVDALAASIASIICMAGDEIRMSPNAQMMIHEPWGMAVGTAADMRKNADALDQVASTLLDTYVARTRGDPKDIKQWMNDETWMTAQMCLDRGFCDAIDDDGQEAAPIQSQLLSKFRNTPRELSDGVRTLSISLARMNQRCSKIRRASPTS